MNLNNMKKCSSCGAVKPSHEFNRDAHLKDGLTSACKACRAQQSREYYAANRTRYAQVRHDWHIANKESVSARKRVYRDQSLARITEQQRRWYEGHREVVRKKSKEWKLTHPEKVRLMSQRGTRMRRARLGGIVISTENWRGVLEKAGNRCLYCGAVGDLHIEHFIPVSRGGQSTLTNILPACEPCNKSKGAHDPYTWIPERFGLEALQRAVDFLGA